MVSKVDPLDEPVYFHTGNPVMVKLGTILGNDLYVSLGGDVEQREHDYIHTIAVLGKALNIPLKAREEADDGK